MTIKNYHLYEVSDFVLDDDFVRWVNTPTAEDETFWSNWLKQHPGQQLAVAAARQIVLSIRIAPEPVSDHTINQEVEKVMQIIGAKKPAAVSIMRRWWFAAACIIVLVGSGIGGAYYSAGRNNTKFSYANAIANQHLIEQVNTSAKPVKITLPDGSTVTLAPSSRISYKNGFDSTGTRDVYLSGEAFFDVTKDALHPFRVFSNEIITKVLGTSFGVSSFDKEKDIKVTVRTGKVSVYSQLTTTDKKTKAANQLDGIIITPNQQLVYKKEQKKFEKELLNNPVMIAADMTPQMMVYEDAPLIKVLKDLKKAYGISLIYDAEVVKNCTLTADFNGESLYTRLDLICTAIGGWYEVIDAQVILHAGGCL